MNDVLELNDASKAEVSRRRGTARWLVRTACLAAAVAALWPVPGWPRLPVLVPSLSPLVAVASSLAVRAIPATAVLGLIVGAIALVRRRWFCRWVCPTGLCADCAGRIGRRTNSRGGTRWRWSPGQWIALATLAGAAAGYPLFAWLDPLAMFSGLFTLTGPARWGALGVPAIVLLSLFIPGLWCSRLCPLGAMQDLLSLAARNLAHQGRRADDAAAAEPRGRLTRRVVLSTAIGAVWAATARALHAAGPGPLRPPGARDERSFTGLCIRCGNCARVCPAGIIAPDAGGLGLAGLLTPVVRFQEAYCLKDCTRCMDVCPSGALRRLSVQQKLASPIGLPRVDMNVCLLGDDHECGVCRNECPYEAISLQFNEADYAVVPRIDSQRCSGCGACETACPTAPVKAIVVRPV